MVDFIAGRYEAGANNITFANNYTLIAPTGTSDWNNYNFISSKVTNGKISTKAGEIPYFHSDYTTAVEMSKSMYNTNSVNSGLITGTMWDVVLKFITEDSTNYSDLINSPWGNYNSDTSTVEGSGITYTAGRGRYLALTSTHGAATGSFTVSDTSYHFGIRTTGWTDGARKNNIYDLAGNLWEWTQETTYYSSNINLFMLRGGSLLQSYIPSDAPVCFRQYYYASYPTTNCGFRPVLYIK